MPALLALSTARRRGRRRQMLVAAALLLLGIFVVALLIFDNSGPTNPGGTVEYVSRLADNATSPLPSAWRSGAATASGGGAAVGSLTAIAAPASLVQRGGTATGSDSSPANASDGPGPFLGLPGAESAKRDDVAPKNVSPPRTGVVTEKEARRNADGTTPSATAILIVWRREANLPRIAGYLAAKPWIEEIIVWNNGRRKLPALPNKTRAVVPLANLKDYSKYMACAEAKTEYCYYQDDDYDAEDYIDNLWDVAMVHPHDITSATNVLTWSQNEYWSVFDERLGLHAQFSWIGCGAVFPRWLAVRHLKLMKEFFSPAEQDLSDVAFAWSTNQAPLQQLQVRLSPIPDPKGFKGFKDSLPENVTENSFRPMRVKTLKTLPAILSKYPMPHKEIESPCYYVAAHVGLALCTTWRPFPTRSISFNISDSSDLDKRTGMYLYNSHSEGHRKHPFLNALYPPGRWKSGNVPVGSTWGISSPRPRNITIHGDGPDQGWRVSVDGGTPNPSTAVWGKEWEILHNITFEWRGGKPTSFNVSKVTHDGHVPNKMLSFSLSLHRRSIMGS